MAVCCSIFAVDLERRERVFLWPRVEDGTAVVKCCEQTFGIIGDHQQEIVTLTQQDHLNPCGLHKRRSNSNATFREPQQALHCHRLLIKVSGHWTPCFVFASILLAQVITVWGAS